MNQTIPPTALARPTTIETHGDVREDAYFWLREKDNPEVRNYLDAENRYTDDTLAHTDALRQCLYGEIVARIQETDVSVVTQKDDYFYYSRTEAGKQYRIHCRRHGSMEAPEQIILDENKLAEGERFFHLAAFSVSPNHRLLAYSTDLAGSERNKLYIKDLDTGELLPECVENTYPTVAWANDSEHLFYVVLNESMRPYRVCRHCVADEPANDTVVFEDSDESFFVRLRRTRSRDFVVISCGSHTTSENLLISADDPFEPPRVVIQRVTDVEYYVEHHSDALFILTNRDAKNFRIVRAPLDRPADDWEELVAHRSDVKLDDLDVFTNHLVVWEREGGLKRIRVEALDSGDVHYVDFDDPAYTLWSELNPTFDTSVLRFHYTSLITPGTVFDYDMATRDRVVRKVQPVLGDFDPSNYVTQRLFATAADGTRVPISVVYRADLRRPQGNPLLLYGYGSYGSNIDPYFQSARLSLLDRGFVYAIAHIRGGGEMGRLWYEQGKLLNKRNTFTDYIACAEYLIEKGLTQSGELVGYGGSAGGLLMGAVVNMRPELFRAIVAHVPFVDVVNTMLDADLPLTVLEYEEWGNPNDIKFYQYIRSYSPYDNVKRQSYPHMLVTAGFNDTRVHYWEPAKWVAKLRTMKTDSNRLLLRTNMGEGHSGASGRYDTIKEVARDYAFILDCFDIKE